MAGKRLSVFSYSEPASPVEAAPVCFRISFTPDPRRVVAMNGNQDAAPSSRCHRRASLHIPNCSLRRPPTAALRPKMCGSSQNRKAFCLFAVETSILGYGRSQRKFHDRQFSIQAVETENVSYLQPVSFGWRPTKPSDRLGDLLLAAHPSA